MAQRHSHGPARRGPNWAWRWLVLGAVVLLSLAGRGPAHAEEPKPEPAGKPQAKTEPPGPLRIATAGTDDVLAEMDFDRTADGQHVLSIPYPIHVTYPAANLELRANGAVIWITPVESADIEALDENEESPKRMGEFLRVMQRVREIHLYAEGPVWMRYGREAAMSTLRAETLYFTITRSAMVDPETGAAEFSLSGVVEGARAHTSAEAAAALAPGTEEVDAETGKPLVIQTGTGTETGIVEAGGVNARVAAEGAVVVKPEPDIFELERRRRFFMRADRLRILRATTASSLGTTAEVEEGEVSASSLAIPSHSFRSSHITVVLRGSRRHVTLKEPGLTLGGVKVFSYPSQRYLHDIDSRFPVTRLDLSSSDAYGFYLRTRLDVIALYDYLADPEPPFIPFELSPLFEWYEERGTATGLEFRTHRIPSFGGGWDSEFQGNYIGDEGDRRPEVAGLGFYPLRSPDRGRFRGWARHRNRSFLSLDAHANYQSDGTYLQEFFRNEYLGNEVEQTFLRIRHDTDYRSFYLGVGVRGRDFADEVERLPEVGFGTFGEPLGLLGLYLTSEGTLGHYRVRTAQPGHPLEGRQVLRADFSARLERPFDLGVATLVPYAGFRMTASDTRYAGASGGNPLYDESTGFVPLAADDFINEGTVRAQLLAGAVLQTDMVRTWGGVSSQWLGMNGLRHVMTPAVRVETVTGPSDRSQLFMQMDAVDAAESMNRVTYSLRNRFQTRRVRQGDSAPSTVDLLDLLVELPTFPNRHRDNGGDLLGDLEVRAISNLSPHVQLRAGGFIDPHDFGWTRSYAAAAFPLGDLESTLYMRAVKGQHEILGASLMMDLSGTYRLELSQEYDMRAESARDTLFRITRTVAEAFTFRVSVRRDSVTRDITASLSLGAVFGP